MKEYRTHIIASKASLSTLSGFSFLILGLLIIWGQNGSLLFNEQNGFEQENALFSQGTDHDDFPLLYLTEETSEIENSKDSNPNDSYRDLNRIYSETVSHLLRIQNDLSSTQANTLDLEMQNRSTVSIIILQHCWKGFIG